MAYYVRYLVQTNRLGKARPTLYVHTSNENKDENQIWYAFGTYETSPNLPWDTSGETVAGSASASWSQEIAKDGGSNGTEMIRASFDRAAMVLTLSSGSGAYDASTQTYAEPSGLFAEPAKFDCSNYQWTQGTANTEYAQLNADADFAVEAQEQEEDQSGELFPSDVTLYPPVINSATQTDKREITVSWAGMVIVGNKGTEVAPQLTLQYSTDGGETWVNSGASVSGQTGTVAVRNLNAATTYYWRMIASWPTLGGGSVGSNEDKFASTITPLKPPVIGTVAALDGEGSVSWGEIAGAVSYLVALVDSENDVPASSVASQGGTTWSFNESSGLTAGMTVQGKWVRVKAVATSNSIEYENSEWSAARLIPDNRTPADEEPTTPVEQIMTRRIYKAIPFIDVPVEQIGGNGSSEKDVITVEYANAHYVQTGEGGGSVPASSLPIATDDALGAIKVGTHLSINAETGVLSVSDNGAIATGNTGLVTGGTVYTEINKYSAFKDKTLETSVKQNNANAVTGGAVYTFVTTASNLPKAKAAGGSGNAGVVYVTNAADKEGLIIDGTNDGQIKVDFATYSSWSSTVTNKVANPSYVKQAIEGYVADTTKVTATGGSGKGGMIVKLDANGFIDGSMLKVVSVTNYYEAGSQAAMTALSDAQDGDICVRTDESETYILMSGGAANGYATASNWKKLTTPTGTVTSVNGKAGASVTLNLTDIYANGSTKADIDTSISTDAISTENYHFPTSKAVQGYVTGLGYQTSSQVSTAISNAKATWNANSSAYNDIGTGLVTQSYLASAFTNYDNDVMTTVSGMLGDQTHVSADITDSVATSAGITSTATGLVQGKAVEGYAAPKTHTHTLGQIIYSGTTGYEAGTTISSSSTAWQLATAKAVYDYKPFVNRIIAGTSGTTTFSGVTTNLATTISSENYSIPTAYAVQQALNGKAASSHNQAITTIYATGTTLFAGIHTSFSTTLNSETYLVPTAYAVQQALAGKAPSTHIHTSTQISDAISTVADPSVNTTFGKVVKTESDWGQIGASLIPIDEQSLEVYTSGGTSVLEVSETWVNGLITGKGYITSSTAANTYARQDSLFPTWTSGTAYSVGDVVWYNNTLWKCHTANTASSSANGSNVPSTNASGEYYTNCWTSVKVDDLLSDSGRYETTLTRTTSATTYNITHNLGSQYVDVSLYDSSNQEVFAAVTATSANVVQIAFGAALASGTETYHVVVRK